MLPFLADWLDWGGEGGGERGDASYLLPREGEAGRIMVPKEIHSPISGACDHVALHGKRDLADVIK